LRDAVEGSHSDTFVTLCVGATLSKSSVLADEAQIRNEGGRLRIEVGSKMTEEYIACSKRKHEAPNRATVTPSVETNVAAKDHQKWMAVLSWVSKCLHLEGATPQVHVLGNGKLVGRAEMGSVWSSELKRLLEEPSRHITDFHLFTHGKNLITITVDVE
jgi:hypothetical protein